jgi:hypothetical protein
MNLSNHDHITDFVAYGNVTANQPRRHGHLRTIVDPHTGQAVTYSGDILGDTAQIQHDNRIAPGVMYVEKVGNTIFAGIDTRSRWQRFCDWIKGKFKR